MIMQTKQKSQSKNKENIDNESKIFAKSIGLEEKMECYSDQSAFIMLKCKMP